MMKCFLSVLFLGLVSALVVGAGYDSRPNTQSPPDVFVDYVDVVGSTTPVEPMTRFAPPLECSTSVAEIVFFDPPADQVQVNARRNADGELAITLYWAWSIIGQPETGWTTNIVPDVWDTLGFGASSTSPFVAAVIRGELIDVQVRNCSE